MKCVDTRLTFAQEVEPLQRQRQWIIDLERLLDPTQQPTSTSFTVAQALDRYLRHLQNTWLDTPDSADRAVAIHIDQIFRSFWWGLFTCYDVDGLPRTNNDLERFMRFLKSGQRRISGRQNVHDPILRYGAFLAFLDPQENEALLLERLLAVSHEAFLQERQTLDATLLREQKRHRFVYHRHDYLADLEQRWALAVDSANP